MSLSNIRDSLVKNTMVSDAQARASESHRPHDAAALQTLRQQAREADEVVIHMRHAAEDNPIRDDEPERQDGRGGRKRSRSGSGDDDPGDAPAPPDDASAASQARAGARRLDILA